MYGVELRWRAVTLFYAYGIPAGTISRLLGTSDRAVRRWYNQFRLDGHVEPKQRKWPPSYPPDVVLYISKYVTSHPCFYVEELRDALKARYPDIGLPYLTLRSCVCSVSS
jgi:hypothetical protein